MLTNTVTFTGTTADVSFTAVNAAIYRVTVLDEMELLLTTVRGSLVTLGGDE